MDWIRRNWPDLLIGIALMAVIAGIIATLLTGGSFFPLGQSANRGGGSSAPLSANNPPQVNPLPPVGDADRTSGPVGDVVGGDPIPGAVPGTNSAADAQDAQTGGNAAGVEVTALPFPGSESQSTGAEGQQPADQREEGESNVQSQNPPASSGNGGNTAANAGSSASAPAASAPATSAPAGDGLYRVSVGAFSASANAQRQAATFRDAGFPVFTGTQGNLSLVLVGPFDTLAEAESAASRIRSGDFGIEPVIYRFQEDGEAAVQNAPSGAQSTGQASSGGANEPSSAAQAQPQAQSQAQPQPQPTAAQAGGERYLQVGAYATSESAQPQVERMESLGFRVTELSEGNLIKLLIGPFSGEALGSARSRLEQQGIEHFPR